MTRSEGYLEGKIIGPDDRLKMGRKGRAIKDGTYISCLYTWWNHSPTWEILQKDQVGVGRMMILGWTCYIQMPLKIPRGNMRDEVGQVAQRRGRDQKWKSGSHLQTVN